IRKYHVTTGESTFSHLILYLIKENNEMRSKISGIEFKVNQLISLKEKGEVKEKEKKVKKPIVKNKP
ncbi:MAG TPA: hypothetical protein PKJ95_03950, partial [Atribacterota bacterium]|nr:hypothetical protein [Atribacterota bacterium]